MKTIEQVKPRTRGNGELGTPTWNVALLFPEQGTWSEEDYLALPGNRLVELSDGFLEILPMPTVPHQWIMFYLSRLLEGFVSAHGLGLVLPAGLRVRLKSGKFRGPDVAFMSEEHKERIHVEYWDGADLVMEVVSGGSKDRLRDLIKKRAEYARARIPEYWIIDPKLEQITVLRLRGKQYAAHGEFKRGDTATSHLLPGFTVDVETVFAGPQ